MRTSLHVILSLPSAKVLVNGETFIFHVVFDVVNLHLIFKRKRLQDLHHFECVLNVRIYDTTIFSLFSHM